MITAEKTLKGRPIGLKASMTKEEMKNHLLNKLKEWMEEGFTEEEVKQAIYNKCKPLGLTSNFYWSRYPEASQRLREVWEELNWNIKESYFDSMRKLRQALKNPKNQEKIREIQKDFLKQF